MADSTLHSHQAAGMSVLHQPLAFVDLETTGANPIHDRITEIGLVLVTGEQVETWSTLVNPQRPIPPFIQHLTGIDDTMVAQAPIFEQVADELAARLAGRLFIAHNARFDYGFIRNAYQRLGRRFRADVLCTVKLSRALYPEHHRHNLDSLVERHGLHEDDRHRALADARLIWQFWRHVRQAWPDEALSGALETQLRRPQLPPGLDPDVVDDLPEAPGAYVLLGEQGLPLWVDKAGNLRKRVLAHFSAAPARARDLLLAREVRRLDWRETVGELGAQLLADRWQRELRPLHAGPGRTLAECYSWTLEPRETETWCPRLLAGAELDFRPGLELFGLYGSRREATAALRKLAVGHQLCTSLLGLDPAHPPGQPCAAHAARKCRGACVGKEALGLHSARLMSALARQKLRPWPYPGPVGLVERAGFGDQEEMHVLHRWRYLGTARDESEARRLAEPGPLPDFDPDTYKLLVKHLGDPACRIVRLDGQTG